MYCFEDSSEFVRAEDEIDFRNLLLYLFAIAFRETPGDDKLFAVAVRLEFRHFENGVDGFFLRAVDESTRIHHDDVGIFLLGSNGIPLPGERSKHDFAVHQVLGTAETHEPDFWRFLFRHVLSGQANCAATDR